MQAWNAIALALERAPAVHVYEAVARVPALDFRERGAPERAGHAGHARAVLVVGGDDFAIGRQVHVGFERVRAELERAAKRRECVFRALRSRPSVGVDDGQGVTVEASSENPGR